MRKRKKRTTPSELERLEKVKDSVVNMRDSAFSRFPFLFIFLSTFGLVATFYGLEKLIEDIPFFVDNPHMILVCGVLTLLATGTLYKKLS